MNIFFEIVKRQLTRTTHRIYTMPILTLMPHSRCNCRCVMCDIWKNNQDAQEISREDLSKHMESLRKLNVRWVVLSGGEAMMHSNLWALCEMLKEQLGVKISLLSTGLLLKRHAEAVVRWCDEVIVSLDGSREIHNRIRNIPRAYARLAEGVQALKTLNPGFRITARCVLQQQNFRDLPNIITAAHDIGLGQISFLAADVSTPAFNRTQLWENEQVSKIALGPEDASAFEALIEETIVNFAPDFANNFIAESPDKLRKLGKYYQGICGLEEFPQISCNAPWVSSVVEADGTVRPCFFHEEIGNIHANSLFEILNAPKAVAFRRNLDVTTNEICRKCVCTLRLGMRAPIT